MSWSNLPLLVCALRLIPFISMVGGYAARYILQLRCDYCILVESRLLLMKSRVIDDFELNHSFVAPS